MDIKAKFEDVDNRTSKMHHSQGFIFSQRQNIVAILTLILCRSRAISQAAVDAYYLYCDGEWHACNAVQSQRSPNHWDSVKEMVSASLLLRFSMTARAKRVEEAWPAPQRSISSHQQYANPIPVMRKGIAKS